MLSDLTLHFAWELNKFHTIILPLSDSAFNITFLVFQTDGDFVLVLERLFLNTHIRMYASTTKYNITNKILESVISMFIS